MTDPTSERQARRTDADRHELAERIAAAQPRDGRAEVQPGLVFNRLSSPSDAAHGVTEPAFCVIAQGSKIVLSATTASATTPPTTSSPPWACPPSRRSSKPRPSSRTSVCASPSTPRSSPP